MNMRNNTLIRMLAGAALVAAGTASAATYTASWAGGGDNLWNNASQWSPTARYPDNGQPTAGDVYTVTVNSTTYAANLNQNIAIDKLTFTAGTITNSGYTLALSQLSDFGGSSYTFLTGTGTLIANAGLKFTPGFSSNPSLRNSWTLELYGSNTCYASRGSGWYMRNTGVITITENATFDLVTAESGRIIDGAGGVFNNAGTFRRITNTAEVEVQNVFNNLTGGNVEVASGSLKLTGGGTHAGAFTVAPSNTLTFGGTHTFNSGASVNSAGNVTFTGPATFASGATLVVGSNLTNNARLTVSNDVTVLGNLILSGGGTPDLLGSGNIIISNRLIWSNVGSSSTLSGSGSVTAWGGMTYTFGYMSHYNYKTMNLYGVSTLDTGAGWDLKNFGTINIMPGASFEIKGGSGGGNPLISGTGTNNNYGTLFRAQNGLNLVDNTLNNVGTVRADPGGRLDFNGAVTQLSGTSITGGTWHANNGLINLPGSNLTTIGPDAVVRLTGTGVINRIGTSLTTVNGGFYVDGGKGFTTGGSGLTVGSSGTLGGDGSVTGNVTVAGGTLAPGVPGASGTLTVAGNLTLQNGSKIQWDGDGEAADRVAVAGTLTLPAAATVVMTSPAGLTLPAEIVLFQAGTLAGETAISGWSVTPPYRAARLGATVVLRRPTGTVVAIR